MTLSTVTSFTLVPRQVRSSSALSVSMQDMMEAPTSSAPPKKKLGKKGKRKAKSAAAAAIADAINGKPPKKKST